MLSVLRDDEKGKKKKGKRKKIDEKWRIRRIQFGTSVGGDAEMAIVPCFFG